MTKPLTKKDKALNFAKRHKKAIASIGAGLIITALGYKAVKACKKCKEKHE